MSAAAPAPPEPFRLRGANFNLLVLRLLDPRVETVVPLLGDQFRRAPGVLRFAPIVIGLDDLGVPPEAVDFPGLVAGLRELKIVPIGTSGGTAAMRAAAQGAGLPPLRAAGTGPVADVPPPAAAEETPAPPPVVAQDAPAVAAPGADAPAEARPTLLVEQSVRSGQRLYAQAADLVVVGTVNPGAEVIADGHVHVYGALRGRAIAGGSRNTDARVFAQNFDPELVSIAGYYAVREGLGSAPIGRAVQARLVGEHMRFDPLA